MMYEFAVDPACVKRSEEMLRVLARVGGEHGRLLADFPAGWLKLVLETAKRHKLLPVEYKRLSRRLDQIRHGVVDTGRRYDETSAWFTNARECSPPFRGVVSPETEGCAELVTLGTEADDVPAWGGIPREIAVGRKASDLVAALEPVVRHAREVILVDPNFSPDTRRWRRPLVGLLKSANRGGALARCEYHLKAKSTEEHFRNALRDQLAPELPEGSCVTFFRWAQWPAKDGQPVGEDLHPRFVLTEFGGVRVDFGLDEGEAGEMTDMVLLDEPAWRRRRADFSAGARTFKLVGDVLRVSRPRGGPAAVDVVPGGK